MTMSPNAHRGARIQVAKQIRCPTTSGSPRPSHQKHYRSLIRVAPTRHSPAWQASEALLKGSHHELNPRLVLVRRLS